VSEPRRLVDPAGLFRAPWYSHAVIPLGSRLVFFAAQVALDRELNVVGTGDLVAQTRQAMANLGVALESVGTSWEGLVRLTVLTTRPDGFEAIGRVIGECLGSVAPPARTFAGVTGFGHPDLLVAIEATATLD
jgi:enamine deaminase RidA (YjgF/YER057c/UK114 family)